jgi:hypothetical protein
MHNIISGTWYKEFLNQPSPSKIALLLSRLLGYEPYTRYRTSAALLTALDELIEELQ